MRAHLSGVLATMTFSSPALAQGAGSWGNGIAEFLLVLVVGAMVLLIAGLVSYVSLLRKRSFFLAVLPVLFGFAGAYEGLASCTGPACRDIVHTVITWTYAAAAFLATAIALRMLIFMVAAFQKSSRGP